MPAHPRSSRFGLALSAGLDRATQAAAWLVLPLAALLFAQWPLRDAVGAWSRQANDIAQWLFALYVAIALRAATRQRAHMAAGLFVARYPAQWQHRLARFGEALCVLPWALFVLVTGAAPTWQSIAGLEAFPDTFNPLYFVVRASAWLLALMLALQALVDLAGAPPPRVEAGDEEGAASP
jgi:TRAP-type C4-dicarboxylate transport system permease small subunit